MHLRLRFQNLGKPRTAGLCGRAARISDCGPLSCAKIERPSPLEKPSCKVQFFAQNRSRKYRQKVTAHSLLKPFSSAFQLRSQTAYVCFHRQKWVHTRLSEENRIQRLTRRNRGVWEWALSLPSDRSARSQTSPGRVSERRTLPLWGLGQVYSRRTQKACGTAMRLCVSLFRRRRGPAGLRDLFHFCRNCDLYALCSGLSACARWGWYHYPRSVPHVSETLRGRGLKRQTLPLLGLGRGCSQRTQRAFGTAMRLCASLSRGVAAPLGCVICLQLGDVAVFSLCAQYFLNVRSGGGITTLGAFHTVRKPCVARG